MNFYSSFDDFLRNARKLTAAKFSVSFREHFSAHQPKRRVSLGNQHPWKRGFRKRRCVFLKLTAMNRFASRSWRIHCRFAQRQTKL